MPWTAKVLGSTPEKIAGVNMHVGGNSGQEKFEEAAKQ